MHISSTIIRLLWAVTVLVFGLLLLVALISFLSTNRQLSRQEIKRTSTQDVDLSISYPQFLFLNQGGNEVRINATANSTVTLPTQVSIYLTLPSGMNLVTDSINGNDQGIDITLPLTVQAPQAQQIIYVDNAGILSRTTNQKITAVSNLHGSVTTQDIHLELPYQAAIRRMIESSINSQVLLAIGAFLPFFIKYLEVAREKEQEENQARQVKAQKLAGQMRLYLIEMNLEGAECSWLDIQEEALDKKLEDRERDWLGKLLHLSKNGRLPDNNQTLENFTKELQWQWPDEIGGALCLAKLKMTVQNSPEHRESFPKIIQNFPLEKITNTNLSDSLIQLGKKSNAFQLQDRVFNHNFKAQAQTKMKKDPLAAIHAEDEVATLFNLSGAEAFWHHPDYQTLKDSTHCTLIYGAEGCGRTALALGLTSPPNDDGNYWVYFSINAETDAPIAMIFERLAQELLQYIEQKPTQLANLRNQNLMLLAQVLCQQLNKSYLLSTISSWQGIENYDFGLTPPDITEAQKAPWNIIRKTQLQLLEDAVEKVDTRTAPLHDSQWLRALFFCFRLLAFNQDGAGNGRWPHYGLRLAFDFAPEAPNTAQEIVSKTRHWQQENIVCHYFMPTTMITESVAASVSGIRPHDLIWQPEHLEKLIQHRFEQISGAKSYQQAFNFQLKTFIGQDKTTPQFLARLWQHLLKQIHATNHFNEVSISKELIIKGRQELKALLESEPTTSTTTIDVTRLLRLIRERFPADSDLKELYIAVGIGYDELNNGGTREKSMALVNFMHTRKRLWQLQQACQNAFPYLPW